MIRDSQIRVIGKDSEDLGIMHSKEALVLAEQAGVDLVEIAGNAKPPVCRIMDYGKFKYEKAKKTKEAKKKQVKVQNKEIKLHLKTDKHDYDFKMKHAVEFLLKGNRVKVTLVFRGREIVYKELGYEIMGRVNDDLGQLATTERKCVMEGRNMISNYVPDKAKVKAYEKEHGLNKPQKTTEDEPTEAPTQTTDVETADATEATEA
ncbi:MAG: translation initiation factor IF-3 [Alteromonadales bacterium]|nr:translation initiation factor IF-3 [Alteromonadales bacterium]